MKDLITGKFYTGESLSIEPFDKAAVYFQRKNAEKKIKELTKSIYGGSWPWLELHWTGNVKELDDYPKKYPEEIERCTKLVNERKNLKDWGIEIVEIIVEV